MSDREELGARVANTLSEWRQISWIEPGVNWALAEAEANDPVIRMDVSTSEGIHEESEAQLKFSQTNLDDSSMRMPRRSAGLCLVGSSGTSQILALIGLLIGFVMVPIYLYYFLMESDAIKQNWHRYVPLKASHFKTEVVDTLREINGYLISFSEAKCWWP